MGSLNEPFFAHDLVLDPEQSFCKRFRPWRAARNVDVDGDDLVDAFTNRVGQLKKSTTAGAASHCNDVFGIRHLIIEKLGALGHFISERSCDYHKIRLTGCGARHRTEAVDISARSSRL